VLHQLIEQQCIQSAHDVSEGGLWTALFESAKVNGLGFELNCDDTIRKDAFLFGEAQGRAIVSISEEQEEAFVELLANSNVPFSILGSVTNGKVIVDEENWGSIESFSAKFEHTLPSILGN
jgi:phosphoribosylformylglycinamidine synthase subunit PurL